MSNKMWIKYTKQACTSEYIDSISYNISLNETDLHKDQFYNFLLVDVGTM